MTKQKPLECKAVVDGRSVEPENLYIKFCSGLQENENLSIDCAQLLSHSIHSSWAGEAEEKSR